MTMKDRLESGNMELGVDGVSSRKMKLDRVEVDNVDDGEGANDRSDSSCNTGSSLAVSSALSPW